jgi:hypothetical protein
VTQADEAFQHDLTDSMRKAYAGLRLSEAEDDRQMWQSRVDALRSVARNTYDEETAAAMEERARQAADVTVDSFLGEIYAEMFRQDERRRS